MINENNLKINTYLNGGSEIDVRNLSIDSFDISKNNLYLFKNPYYENALEEKNKNSKDWEKAPEDYKEIALKQYISIEEFNKINPAQDRKRLYEVIEEKKYATLKGDELKNFNEDILLVDRVKKPEKDDVSNLIEVKAEAVAEAEAEETNNVEDDDEGDDVSILLEQYISSPIQEDDEGYYSANDEIEAPNNNNYVGVGGGIPTSEAITRLFKDDTSPANIVGILKDFNWGDDHIMVNDIKVKIPESYDEWFAKQTENMKKFVADNKLSLDLIRFSNLLRNNYQFYNPNFKLEEPTPDNETGVKYNKLVEKVDIEALQQLVKESHMRFRLHIQEFFGTLGLNPGIQVEISQLGGFINNLSVTEEQLNGGMIPMLVPFSLVSKVPSFMDDIEERLKSIIKRLENNGKKLVGDSKENIFKAVDRVKKQEKQLKVLANSLEKIVKDPLSKNEVTLDEVLKYSNKLEKGQIRGLDVAKTLVELEVS